MQRDLAALAERSFDLVVAGGGVVGAAIARDAARRGLAVALVEAEDFACAASEGMSHFVHGGIRYLATGEFSQVRHSLRERAIWMHTAPTMVVPQACITPLAGKSRFEAVQLGIGVHLFNLLGGRNVLAPGARSPVKLSARDAVRAEPAIDQSGLTGALVYHDCRVDEPERVVLAVLKDAVAHGAVVVNHAACAGLAVAAGRVTGVEVKDGLSGATIHVRAGALVNATGPWAESVATRLLTGQRQARLTMSKGIHIVTGLIARTHSLNLAGDHEHATVLPWRGMSLIGTTDDVYDGDPAGAVATDSDIERLIAKIERLLPSLRGTLSPVIDSYAALRALPGRVSDSYGASREDAIVDHAGDGAHGFLSVYGGKWTTARMMGEKAVDALLKTTGGTARPCDTATAMLPDMASRDLPEEQRFAIAVADEMAVTPADIARRLARAHAVAHPGVLERAAHWLAAKAKLADAAPRPG